MKQTDNYGLVIYEKGDKFNIKAEENSLNASMKIIDETLHEKANSNDIKALTNLEIESLLEQQV